MALALAALVLGAAPVAPAVAADVDLSKVERRLAKEPAYQTTAPKYCLLVFGAEAATRVWIVMDGDVLYIDRNGNGDLTDDGEKVKIDRPKGQGENVGVSIDAGAVTAKAGVPANTKIEVTQFGERTYVECNAEGRARQYAGRDAKGLLRFAERPSDAPVVHFGGPIALAPDEPYTLERGDKPTEFYAFLGTPGLGAGAFASMGYGEVPRDVHPVAEFTFPAKQAGQPPPTLKVVLKQRC
jgi:hypothetical protein